MSIKVSKHNFRVHQIHQNFLVFPLCKCTNKLSIEHCALLAGRLGADLQMVNELMKEHNNRHMYLTQIHWANILRGTCVGQNNMFRRCGWTPKSIFICKAPSKGEGKKQLPTKWYWMKVGHNSKAKKNKQTKTSGSETRVENGMGGSRQPPTDRRTANPVCVPQQQKGTSKQMHTRQINGYCTIINSFSRKSEEKKFFLKK